MHSSLRSTLDQPGISALCRNSAAMRLHRVTTKVEGAAILGSRFLVTALLYGPAVRCKPEVTTWRLLVSRSVGRRGCAVTNMKPTLASQNLGGRDPRLIPRG